MSSQQRVLVAVDFGTTYTGISWIKSGDSKRNSSEEDVEVIRDWNKSKGKNHIQRTFCDDCQNNIGDRGYEAISHCCGSVEHIDWNKIISERSFEGDPRLDRRSSYNSDRPSWVDMNCMDQAELNGRVFQPSRTADLCAGAARNAVKPIYREYGVDTDTFATGLHGNDTRSPYTEDLGRLTAACRLVAEMLHQEYCGKFTNGLELDVMLTLPECWSSAARDAACHAARNGFSGLVGDVDINVEFAVGLESTSNVMERTGIDQCEPFWLLDSGGSTRDLISYQITPIQPSLQRRTEVVRSDDNTSTGSTLLNMAFKRRLEQSLGSSLAERISSEDVKIEMLPSSTANDHNRDSLLLRLGNPLCIHKPYCGPTWHKSQLAKSSRCSTWCQTAVRDALHGKLSTLQRSIKKLDQWLPGNPLVMDPDCSICWWTQHPAPRRLVKGAVLLIAPIANATLRMYGLERGLVLSGSTSSSSTWYSGHTDPGPQSQESLVDLVLHWTHSTPPLLFFASSIILASLLSWYYEVNENHRYQRHILLMGLLAWPVTAIVLGAGTLPSILFILPWTIYGAFILSEVVHLFVGNDERLLLVVDISAKVPHSSNPRPREPDHNANETKVGVYHTGDNDCKLEG